MLDPPADFLPLCLTMDPVMRIDVRKPDVVVGRHSEADVRLTLPDISRRHCRLVFENQHWRVLDLKSLNGVFVNGERMHEATLYSGDHLQLGELDFLVEYGLPAAAPDGALHQDVLQGIGEAKKEQKWAS
jgi:pSer/pThr/pTyr-binding forkhead associated (FHA) protein